MVAEHITNLPCDKHSGKRTRTQMLVVHSIESPLANGYAVSMAKNWLGKWYDGNGALIEASSNVIVSPDTLVRSVHTDYAAWHASWANSLSVGYEQAGYAAFTRAQWLTDLGKTQIDRLAREMAMDAELYDIPLVWLTRAQVNAIAAGDRTIKGLVTHAVIDPVNRTDPGSQYPYDVLLASIRKYAGGSSNTPTITPITEEGFLMALSDADQIEVRDNLRKLVGMTADVQGKVADIGTASGTKSLRQFVADGTRAAQTAAAQTANIRRGGQGISLRQEVADIKTSVTKSEPVIVAIADAVVTAPDVDGEA